MHQTRSLSRASRLDQSKAQDLDTVLCEMEEQALADLVRERFPRDQRRTLRSAGTRYRGQSYGVSVPVGR